MVEKKQIFTDDQKVGFQKFATNILKKEYPFISRIEFTVFPINDPLDFTFKMDVFLDYNYLINDDRVLRHVTVDELKLRLKRSEIISAWEARLFFVKYSPSDLAKKIQELVSIMVGNEKINKLYNVWDIRYLIDPRTYVS